MAGEVHKLSMSGHQSARAKSVSWLTPPEILRPLGGFDLDPCCPPVMPWHTAKEHYVEEQDGLAQPWSGRVWMNPPFGRAAQTWMKRLAEHGNGIALIPARTETEMFYESVWGKADAVLFVKGRPHFYAGEDMILTDRKGGQRVLKLGQRAPFNSGAPICLVAYGEQNVVVLEQSGLGKVVKAN